MPVSHCAIHRSSRGESGMSHGWTNTGRPGRGAVLQEGDDAGVVEIAVADVVADLDAAMAAGKAAIELGAGGVGVLQRHLAERQQPVRRRARRSPAPGR